MSMVKRYTDAYLVARTTTVIGEMIKVGGFLVAALIVAGGWFMDSKFGAGFVGYAGSILGLVLVLVFYVLGVLVVAQGQILRATLDTAVNSSTQVSKEDVARILSLG